MLFVLAIVSHLVAIAYARVGKCGQGVCQTTCDYSETMCRLLEQYSCQDSCSVSGPGSLSLCVDCWNAGTQHPSDCGCSSKDVCVRTSQYACVPFDEIASYDANGWIQGDPHLTTFDGHHYNFQDKKHDLEKTTYDYAAPCSVSDLRNNNMPFKVGGKHLQLTDDGLSGVEYIILQLFDYDGGNLYIVWLSSIIHHWMRVDLAPDVTDVDSKTLLFHQERHNTTATKLQSGVEAEYGSKFMLMFVQATRRQIKAHLIIDNKCTIFLDMLYQEHVKYVNPEVNGRHGLHKFNLQMECYRCLTCGLLGSNLCDGSDTNSTVKAGSIGA